MAMDFSLPGMSRSSGGHSLDFRLCRKSDDLIEDSPVTIGEFRPEFQIALDCFGIESRQHSGLEVGYLAGIVRDVIAIRVANCLAGGTLVHDVPNGVTKLFHRVRSAKDEE